MSGSSAPGTVLITGGAGFIGSQLADALLDAGHRVIVIDDLSTGRRANVHADAELHELDVRSPQAAQLVAASGADVLIHHAAQINVRQSMQDPCHDADVNVVGSLNLLEAAREGGVRQVLFASTGGAIYGEQAAHPADETHPTFPVSHYGVSKLAVERYLYTYHHTYGLDVSCLRYANVYGERQNPFGDAGVVAIFLQHLLEGRRPTIHGAGDQTRDYVHVSDVVQANLAALGRPGFAIYNVGTGIETSVLGLYRQIARSLGSEIEPHFGPAKSGDPARSSIDPSRLRGELDWGPPLVLAEGLERTARWFEKQRQGGAHSP